MDTSDAKDKINDQIQKIAEATKKAFRKPNGGGRPTKLTPEVQETICSVIMAGGFPECAARIAGIDKTTFYDWLKKGGQAKSKSNKFKQFSHSVEEAGAYLQMRLVLGVVSAGINSPEYLKWLLSKRFPDTWGGTTAINADGRADGANSQIEDEAEAVRIAEQKVRMYHEKMSITIESIEVKESITIQPKNGDSPGNGTQPTE